MRTPHTASATVATAAPLTVTVDGNTAAVPAAALNGAGYTAGVRVTVLIRNGLKPLVLGAET